MSKNFLLFVGIVLILMGIGGMLPSMTMATEPMWHAITKIVIGLISVYISMADKK